MLEAAYSEPRHALGYDGRLQGTLAEAVLAYIGKAAGQLDFRYCCFAESLSAETGDGARQHERHALPSVEGLVVHSSDGVLHALMRHRLRDDYRHAFRH